MTKIPKVIHYCWFGGKELPELAQRCILSWKKYCPEYKIIEWNESNFDLNICQYVREAYNEKKWAFVSDYVRFWVLYNYGGIYVDTDVEFIKPIDTILENGAYMGCERVIPQMSELNGSSNFKFMINPGLGLAAPANHFFVKEVLESFHSRSFYKESGEVDLTTIVDTTTFALKKYGYVDSNVIQNVAGFTIYPQSYFCPQDYITGDLIITDDTYSIHHYTASWKSDKEKKQFKVLQMFQKKLGIKLGYKFWRIYLLPSRIAHKIHILGYKGTLMFIMKKIRRKV